MNRRKAIKTVLLVSSVAATGSVFAQGLTDFALKAIKAGNHPFALPALPYPLDALSPHIDARTLEAHRNIHAAQVKNLNMAIGRNLKYYAEWEPKFRDGLDAATAEWLRVMLKDLNRVPENIRDAVRDEGGGHHNHSLFWLMMKKGGGGSPRNELALSIERSFGSFNAFKNKFSNAASRFFGSGWVWLTMAGNELRIETTPNEESPVSAGREVLAGIDVWEHAYYRQYQNRCADYIAGWWNVVNWDFVAERFAALNRVGG